MLSAQPERNNPAPSLNSLPQATLCKHLQFLEEHISEKTMISIWNATLITLYLNYDITEDFQTQFQQNSDAILSLIETLGTVDIPKKS